MDWLRISAVTCSFLSLLLLLIALGSDYWVVASDHTGLWKGCSDIVCIIFGFSVQDYVHATRAFMLIGMIAGAVSFFGLCVSFRRPSTTMIAAIASFVAGFCALIAMAVFTGVYSGRYSSLGASYGWSFALGWVSFPLFLVTGGLAYKAHALVPVAGHTKDSLQH